MPETDSAKQVNKRELEKKRRENAERAKEISAKMLKRRESSNIGYYVMFGIIIIICVYMVVMMVLNSAPNLSKIPVIDEVKIADHNEYATWTQGGNSFFEGYTLADAKKLMANSFSNSNNIANCPVDVEDVPIPDNFDSRDQWKQCVLPVVNQGTTCSSYGVAVAQTIAERACIAGGSLVSLSAQELISCDEKNKGCAGGHLNNALDYAKFKGLVTEKCFPYKEGSKCNKCETETPSKIQEYCLAFNEDNIKREILKNGPLLSVAQIYTDFLTYKSGIYKVSPDTPKFTGFHPIKIVGWGADKEEVNAMGEPQKYWLIQNSWGEDWGENGYVKVGLNQEMFFEKFAYSIRPEIDLKLKERASEQAKEEIKEEIKQEIKEEVKKEVKKEVKQEIKKESTEEPKKAQKKEKK